MATRPAIFKWRQTEPGLILCAVRWYLRYSLSLRDVEELLEERGLKTDHTTVWPARVNDFETLRSGV
jgi:IS6 family transposase